jgi:uncharacterized protein (TIGR02453 family)
MAVRPEAAFSGFGAGAVAWFEGLERDNTRTYFQATRDTYEDEVREPLTLLLEELSVESGGVVHVFRQHRDVRFSPDKSPYKTRTYGVVGPGAGSAAALYAAVSSSGLYAGTGYWRMAPDQLERFRAAVIEDGPGEALADAVASVEREGVEIAPPALKTAPRGFPRDHPRVALLRYKDMFAGRQLPPGPDLATRTALEHVAGVRRAARPLTGWLDEHVGPSTLPESERMGRRR